MLYLFLALILAAVDQLTKALTVSFIALGDKVSVFPGIVGLTHTRNTGMAFSMLSDSGWLLPVVSGVMIIALVIILFVGKFNKFERVCLALAIGGALGNGVDRALYGYVVDMIEVQFMNFAIFNFADCCIVVGCILFAIAYIFFHGDDKKKKMAEIERLKEDDAEEEL
ncbi:MAG: signal peptidase II [Ruminococcaceae bacterium]|nr:signal peptidase II [Oscillospiraceae bacterium]